MEFRITTALTAEERDQWDRFVASSPVGHTFQSYAWGEFQEALTGRNVFYLIGSHQGQWRSVAQIFHRAWPWPLHRLGNYEISCGPIFLDFADLEETLGYLDRWAAERSVRFFIGPRCEMGAYPRLLEACRKLHFYPTEDPSAAIYGQETLLIDLRPPEEEIYRKIRYTTRYEIRKAQQAGVTVHFSNDADAIETFYDIYRKQEVRKDIQPIDKRYFVLLCKHLLADPAKGVIAVAEFEGRPLSTAVCFSFGKTAWYVWGASDEALKRKMPAAHLLHWELMRRFKKRGCDWYDFSGASPSLPRSYFSYGVNLFKIGFSKNFVKYTPDFVKTYQPFWAMVLGWRDRVSAFVNTVRALSGFRWVTSIRNKLDVAMLRVPTTPTGDRGSRWPFMTRTARTSLIVSLLFLVCAGFVMTRHELWGDELRPWMMARNSPSTAALLNQIRDEGASPLWPMCLRLVSHWNPSPQAMQLFNLGLGAALIFLFWAFAPFSPFQKILLTFNYYLFYQYAVVSRHYLLGLLFLALACVFYETRWTRPVRLGAVIFLACMTSRNATLVALGISSAFLWDALHTEVLPRRSGSYAMAIFAVNIFLTGMSMRPVLGVPYYPEWYLHPSLSRFLWLADVYAKAFLAIPVPGRPFWGIIAIERLLLASKWIIPVALGLLGWCLAAVRIRGSALVGLLVSTGSLLLFFYAGFLGIYRHAGFLFFAFLFSWWLSRAENRWSSVSGFWGNSLLTGLLVIQMAGGMIAAAIDVRYPYSRGKETAEYIASRGFQDAIIAVGNSSLAIPLTGYLDRPLFYAEHNQWTSYSPWVFPSDEKTTDELLLQRAEGEATNRQMEILMILDHPLEDSLQKAHRLEFLRSFTGAYASNENYYLYYQHF